MDRESVLRGIFMVDWLDGFDHTISESPNYRLQTMAHVYRQFMAETVHNGDCVNAPATCIVCMMADYGKQADRVMAAFDRASTTRESE